MWVYHPSANSQEADEEDDENSDPATAFTVIGGISTIELDGTWIPDDAPTAFGSLSIIQNCKPWMFDRRDN